MTMSNDESGGVVDTEGPLTGGVELGHRVRNVKLKRAFLRIVARIGGQVCGDRKSTPRSAAVIGYHRSQGVVRVDLRETDR